MASDESGIHLIKRAIELDTNKRYADALVCYREGIELLMDSIKLLCQFSCIFNPKDKSDYRRLIDEVFVIIK